ncbi:MAG: hypothetical protein K2R98_33125 [Gemmataceae bacterium]|nr:hypothetical protein [Gemmataceae bacterium]
MSAPSRILLVNGSAPPVVCGIGDYTACLAKALSALEGMDIGLFTSRCPGRTGKEAQLAGVQLLDVLEHWQWSDRRVAQDAIDAWCPDLLHIQYPSQGYDGVLLAPLSQWFRHLRKKPVVITMHEHIMPQRLAKLMIAQAAHEVISVRPTFRQGLRMGLSWTTLFKPFHFIPNASSLPRITPTPESRAQTRLRLGVPAAKGLVAYFGLLYPRRGVDQLFAIADPAKHHLVILGGQIKGAEDYCRALTRMAQEIRWSGSVTFTGFLPDEEAATILACADAIVLPFTDGGGIWNTSLHGARLQGTFVLTTSKHERGYDPVRNVCWAAPHDIVSMRESLERYLGFRHDGERSDVPQWEVIARQHRDIYERLITRHSR